jgi:rhodanese-related sulfurtransferase
MKVWLLLSFVLLAGMSQAQTTTTPAPAHPMPTSVPPTPTVAVTPYTVAGVTPDVTWVPEGQYRYWPHIDLYEVERLHTKKSGVLFVDARSQVEFESGHIPRAISVPLGDFDQYFKKYAREIRRAKVIVVYCHGGGCHLSEKTCEKFYQKGFRNVVNFYNGWPAWQQANLPVQDKSGKVTYPPVPTPVPHS